ncbi:MAG: methyltransferase domain-containing protein [Patescibacteria group bacterium]
MFLRPRDVLERISIPAGSRVGDFGSGAGHFALGIIDRLGPETTVYAFDALAPVLAKLSREAKRRGGKLYAIEADLNVHIPVADNLLHFAILANILHAVSNRERFLSELARVVRPGGRALVIDWTASFKNMGPTAGAVVTPSQAVRLLGAAGFSANDMLPAGSHHWAFLATLR